MVLQWSDQHKIGNEVLDAQHRALFSLANEVLTARTSGERALHLMNFYLYAREHFRVEEFLMTGAAFPGRDDHAVVHAQMLEQLNDMRERASDPGLLQEALERLLNKWLLGHICDSDQLFSDHQAQGSTPANGPARSPGNPNHGHA